jgi:hypothetical protein
VSERSGNRSAAAVRVGADEVERWQGALSTPHTLRHEAVLGRAVKRLAVRHHRLTCAGVTLALLHEAHLSSAVKRFAARANCVAIAGLCCCRTDREAGNQHR